MGNNEEDTENVSPNFTDSQLQSNQQQPQPHKNLIERTPPRRQSNGGKGHTTFDLRGKSKEK